MKPSPSSVRPAAVSGTFYPGAPAALRGAVAGHLARAVTAGAAEARRPPKLLLVPHAGYVYSGDVAAQGYAGLARWRGCITRVVLLGPAHRVAVQGLAAPTVDAFQTPLGPVALDTQALAELDALPQVQRSDLAHAQEHALEVQLPFLQAVLGDGFTLVPLVVGHAGAAQVAEVLQQLWGGDETLIVISSDLSHYLPYAQAQARDQATVQRILHFATDLQGDEACGAAPLNGALRLARQRGLVPQLLALRNSGDAAAVYPPGRDRVVGYAAVAFEHGSEAEAESASTGDADDAALGRALVQQARTAIAGALGLPWAPDQEPTAHPALKEPGATFVTLHDAAGKLRGCVGRLQAVRALGEDVRANALAAAFEDSRFAPLRRQEWPGLQVEVSLLDPPEPLPQQGQAQLLRALRPGVDGVILEWRDRRATFLPQVWQQLPDPAEFMAALKHKAGLAADFWSNEMRLWRYRVRSFTDDAGPRHDMP